MSKVVQTEMGQEEYRRLRRVAEEEGLSLKEALRVAAREFSDRHLRYDPEDPLFTATPGEGERETDARRTGEYLADAVAEDGEEYG